MKFLYLSQPYFPSTILGRHLLGQSVRGFNVGHLHLHLMQPLRLMNSAVQSSSWGQTAGAHAEQEKHALSNNLLNKFTCGSWFAPDACKYGKREICFVKIKFGLPQETKVQPEELGDYQTEFTCHSLEINVSSIRTYFSSASYICTVDIRACLPGSPCAHSTDHTSWSGSLWNPFSRRGLTTDILLPVMRCAFGDSRRDKSPLRASLYFEQRHQTQRLWLLCDLIYSIYTWWLLANVLTLLIWVKILMKALKRQCNFHSPVGLSQAALGTRPISFFHFFCLYFLLEAHLEAGIATYTWDCIHTSHNYPGPFGARIHILPNTGYLGSPRCVYLASAKLSNNKQNVIMPVSMPALEFLTAKYSSCEWIWPPEIHR